MQNIENKLRRKIFNQSKIVKMWCFNILWELEEINLMRHKKAESRVTTDMA
jgi:hypothetical protein